MRGGAARRVVSRKICGSPRPEPYTSVEDFTITLRTGESMALAAARRFIVPMTFCSCIVRPEAVVESTRRCVCTTVSMLATSTMRRSGP